MHTDASCRANNAEAYRCLGNENRLQFNTAAIGMDPQASLLPVIYFDTTCNVGN